MPKEQGSAGASKLPLPIRGRPPPTRMSSPDRPRPRSAPRGGATPKPADGEDDQPARAAHTTPINNNNTNPRFSIRTPSSQVIDFRASRQLLSASGRGAGGGQPTHFTPHGRAAMRAMDSRRAAINDINTPRRNRRRSMRDQRETPRDVLRALSKTLAPKSKAVSSTSSSSSPDNPSAAAGGPRPAVTIPEDPDDSDEFPIDRPRFSLPIDEDADSDGELPRPPRSSGLEDLEDNFTMQSIELPRRATMGTSQRFSMRMSDYGPLGDGQSDDGDGGIDTAFFPRPQWDDDTGDATGMGGEEDATLERVDDEAARRDTLGGRISDFGAIDFNLDAGDQSTVILEPQVQSSPQRGGFSPDNEPFGFDDEPPPLEEDEPSGFANEMDVEDDAPMDMDIAVGEDDDAEIGDLAAEAVIARQTSNSANRVRKRGKKISRYGIEYPSLPPSVVKRLAQRFAGKTKISPDTLSAIMQASDWFFEQLGDDLRAYANHARGRTTINESDMLTLMRRYVPFDPILSIAIRVSWFLYIFNCTHKADRFLLPGNGRRVPQRRPMPLHRNICLESSSRSCACLLRRLSRSEESAPLQEKMPRRIEATSTFSRDIVCRVSPEMCFRYCRRYKTCSGISEQPRR